MLQFFDTLTDDSGNSLLGATVAVTAYPGGGATTIYSSNGTIAPIATSTVVADITGQVSFFAPDGAYILTYSYKGTPYKTRSPVQFFDPMAFVAAADGGASANNYAISGSQYPAQKYVGLKVEIKAAHTNTGASTLVYQADGGLPINQPGGAALIAGMLQANGLARFEWDGTQWQLIGSQSQPFYAVIAAESGVTVTNLSYTPGDLRRYGSDPTGVADSTVAINAGFTVWVAGGPVPFFVAGTYKTTSALNVPQGLFLNLGGATIAPTGTANAFTLSNSIIAIENGFITLTGTTGRGIYAPAPIQQFTFRDLWLTCATGNGIELVDCYEGYFENIHLQSGSAHSIYLRSTIGGTPTNSIILNRISQGGFTTTGDILTLEGAAGIRIINLDSENNTGVSNDVRIVSNASNGTTGITLDGAYFEDGINKSGNSVYIGDSAAGTMTGIQVLNGNFQTSKQPIKVGTTVDNSLKIVGNVFTSVTGVPVPAILIPANYVPNVYDNGGSVQDLPRTFTPTVFAGGTACTLTTAVGRYRRIDNRMFGEIQVVISNLNGGTGLITIQALPIATNASSLVNMVLPVNYAGFTGLTGALQGRIGAGSTVISISQSAATQTNDIANTALIVPTTIYMQFAYEI